MGSTATFASQTPGNLTILMVSSYNLLEHEALRMRALGTMLLDQRPAETTLCTVYNQRSAHRFPDFFKGIFSSLRRSVPQTHIQYFMNLERGQNVRRSLVAFIVGSFYTAPRPPRCTACLQVAASRVSEEIVRSLRPSRRELRCTLRPILHAGSDRICRNGGK